MARLRRVRVLTANAQGMDAYMTFGTYYQMQAERNDRALQVHCSCPEYRGEEPCKHVWALLCLARDRGYLQGDGTPVERLEGKFHGARKPPDWRALVRSVQSRPALDPEAPVSGEWPKGREVFYVLDMAANAASSTPGIAVDLAIRDRLKTPGAFALSKPKSIRLRVAELAAWPDLAQRDLLLSLAGIPDANDRNAESLPTRFHLRPALLPVYVPRLCESGRLFWRESPKAPVQEWQQLSWDPGAPWRFVPEIREAPEIECWKLTGKLERDGEQRDLESAGILFAAGFVILDGVIAGLVHEGQFGWIAALRAEKDELIIPASQAAEFVGEVISGSQPLRVEWPAELAYTGIQEPPRFHLRLKSTYSWRKDRTEGKLRVFYGPVSIPESHRAPNLVDPKARLVRRRDEEAERTAKEKLVSLGLAQDRFYSGDHSWDMPTRNVSRVVRELARAGWALEVEGEEFRQATQFDFNVTSGIDWFDLQVSVSYDGAAVTLPTLLQALEKGEAVVVLPGGGFGVLPPDLVERYGTIVSMGKIAGESVRFKRSQAGLLDLLLADKKGVRVDEVFAEARAALRAFDGIQPVDQPAGFAGTLRDYQRHGLAWMKFLDNFGFGGCLADDMGVGKTPQVLALLESRRVAGAGPSLAVMPRSLVDNWIREAARFTPELKVLDHSGSARGKDASAFSGYHLVIATYGTLRRDAVDFREFEFDYVILDEAQAIKNPASESAKAARLLNGRRRLAMTGTPVENHLGELWSLFEFLNPGMLGTMKAFDKGGSPESRELLARALRPFILRRTKGQVAKELPPKTAQTLYCEMEPAQRKLYDELRAHYRQSILGEDQGGRPRQE
ncbi:MAG: SWIM zinc finger family protein [Bryobacteraceae bacterium]|nr:SWIM zinc finger family protein [Bryobacteraceae bacterium]